MTSNKIKTKGKECKTNRNVNNNNEDSEDIDFSQLRRPIHTSVTGLAQAIKIFDIASEELKGLLSNECDILYECKVCRSIFRSLPNFISHKRIYCKDNFNSLQHSHFLKNNSTITDILKIKCLEESYQESLNKKNKDDLETVGDSHRIPFTKDLTAVIEQIAKNRGIDNKDFEQQMILQEIPNSSVAVYQSMKHNHNKKLDHMRSQVEELNEILSKDKAVLQKDGKFKVQSQVQTDQDTNKDNVIQISDDEDDLNILKCKICDLQFATQKTLKFHMKCKHLESRLVYPCPDCMDIFSNSWSVYRHLFKVHRKTAAQIRRLRESIQAKAFKMNNPPAYYEKRKNMNMKIAALQKASECERLDQENQEWMDNMEGDGEIPRCGGCGRNFERRAALAAHTHTCQPRSRALSRRHDAKKIEIQIRKDYNKGPAATFTLPTKTADNTESKFMEIDIQSRSQLEDKQTDDKSENDKVEKSVLLPVKEANSDETEMEVIEIDEELTNENKNTVTKSASNCAPVFKLPFAQMEEKSNLAALNHKIQSDIDQLYCKRCDTKCVDVNELYQHVANHYNWMRYACKLCNFKHYELQKLPEHLKVVHKLKGDTEFYFSTVKALDGPEALELLESNDVSEMSPESRRPSRCSSDSSRLSDDSSCSSIRIDCGSKKRKRNRYNMQFKKIKHDGKNELLLNDDEEQKDNNDVDKTMDVFLNENDPSSNPKTFEENSSDMDDVEEKFIKRQSIGGIKSAASHRPVRKRTRPKNEDFEYDLSNLLKTEAQAYRGSQIVTSTKVNLSKKKSQEEPTKKETQINTNTFNITNSIKNCTGALFALSKKAVEFSAAHMQVAIYLNNIHKQHSQIANVFARPMVPKNAPKTDKTSPKKDIVEDSIPKTIQLDKNCDDRGSSDKIQITEESKDAAEAVMSNNKTENTSKEQKNVNSDSNQPARNKPAVLPIKFSRQNLGLVNNPIINKNIQEFSKTGMKTKILVIKPINRANKDGVHVQNTPLKFQTIKIKDPTKKSSANEKPSDQIVVVKFPKVDSAARPADTTDVDKTESKSIINKTAEQTDDCKQNEIDKSVVNAISINKEVNDTGEAVESESVNQVKLDVSNSNDASEHSQTSS